jgi:predicted PurR-regulated permease PerM
MCGAFSALARLFHKSKSKLKTMKISFKNIFYILASIILLIVSLHFARPVMIPIASALLLSFILFPVASKLEDFGIGRITSTTISIVGFAAVILAVFYLFSRQIISLVSQLSEFRDRLSMVFEKSIQFLNEQIPVIPKINRADIITKSQEWVKESGIDIMSDTVGSTTTFFSGLAAIVVYTFLLLIYRSGLMKIFVDSVKKEYKPKVRKMIVEMQKVGQNYVLGMSIMILILGIANSIVLLLFNIDHPFLFGFFAGLLALIPYIGTAIGGLIPVLYAFMTQDSIWIPVGIAGSFWAIQTIEGNFLNPKIVGGNLNVNALAAIISLIVGGYLWGIAGMILFLPLAAIFRVFCSYFEEFKPVSLFMKDDLFESKDHKHQHRKIFNISKLFGKKRNH